MLKLKKNISLKELEKFGFRYVEDRSFEGDFSYCDKYIGNNIVLSISLPSRILYTYTAITEPKYVFSDGLDVDVLFDLIKADLIEKMEEK